VTRIVIQAPARLRFGFLDPEGGLGRRFAGLGLAIDAFATRLVVTTAVRDMVHGPEAERIRALLTKFRQAWPLPPVAVDVLQAIPAHVGLGSGTQLALALGRGLALLAGIKADTVTIARLAGRGLRSGLGVGAFDAGGFLLDGGRAETEEGPPPIISRLPFPDDWRLVLILDSAATGLSGEAERQAFAELGRFPPERAAHLCRLALMRVLPGVACADFAAVAAGIGEIQRILGAWYAPCQGGALFSSPAVGEVARWLAQQGYRGLGQSSWGPTGFVLVPDVATAEALSQALRMRFARAFPQLRFIIARGRNSGASVERAVVTSTG
jgi:beta-RFAP synthase